MPWPPWGCDAVDGSLHRHRDVPNLVGFVGNLLRRELPNLAEAVEEVGADTFCATIVPIG